MIHEDYSSTDIFKLVDLYTFTKALYDARVSIGDYSGGSQNPFYNNVWIDCGLQHIDRDRLKHQLNLMEVAIQDYNRNKLRIIKIDEEIQALKLEKQSLISKGC